MNSFTEAAMGTETTRRQQKARTRRQVLEAAYALFEERGYAKTTMRELAARAGVALGTIFLYFPNKPSLLIATFQEDLGAVIDQGFDTLPTGADLKSQLLHLAGGFYRFYSRRPALSRVVLKSALFLEGDAAAALEGMVATFVGQVAILYQQAVNTGELAPDTEAAKAALGFWADYYTVLIFGLSSEATVQAQLELLGELLEQRFSGLRASKEQ